MQTDVLSIGDGRAVHLPANVIGMRFTSRMDVCAGKPAQPASRVPKLRIAVQDAGDKAKDIIESGKDAVSICHQELNTAGWHCRTRFWALLTASLAPLICRLFVFDVECT